MSRLVLFFVSMAATMILLPLGITIQVFTDINKENKEEKKHE